jgi:endonuclease YncB( thermonuclease family)
MFLSDESSGSVISARRKHVVRQAFGIAIFALLVVLALPVFAETLLGNARVIDGDTIELEGERIRFQGIDTPEARQLCEVDGEEYRCGDEATAFLVDLISGGPITCIGDTRDRYKRLIGVCYVGEISLNAALVRAGWAVAYRRYSMDYVEEEEAAHSEGIGLWRGTFEMPWKWRRAH